MSLGLFKEGGKIGAVFLLTFTLAACAGVTWECKVGGTVGQKPKVMATASGGAVINADVSGALSASSMIASFAHMAGASTQPDAASISMDVSDSTTTWPASGMVTLTLRKKTNGSVLASRSFGWRRSGSILKLSDPGAVNGWLVASGADASSYKLEYKFQNLVLPAQPGSNLIAVDVYENGAPRATAASTILWDPADSCDGPIHTTCEPR